jgi:hypothetical protein
MELIIECSELEPRRGRRSRRVHLPLRQTHAIA